MTLTRKFLIAAYVLRADGALSTGVIVNAVAWSSIVIRVGQVVGPVFGIVTVVVLADNITVQVCTCIDHVHISNTAIQR